MSQGLGCRGFVTPLESRSPARGVFRSSQASLAPWTLYIHILRHFSFSLEVKKMSCRGKRVIRVMNEAKGRREGVRKG